MALKHDELDTLIDDVAREMTAGGPGACFTSDVLGRIDERRPAWRSAWFLSPIAAAAVVLIALFVWRGARPDDRGPEKPAVQAAGPVARPFQGRDQQSADHGPESPALQAVSPAPAVAARAVQASDPSPSDIDALTIASIAVDTLAETPLAGPESIQSDPLTTIAPLTVTPLESGDETQRRFE